MNRLIVANWKMNLGPAAATLLVKRLEQKIEPQPGVEVVICPPFVDLVPLARELDRSKLALGAQTIHEADSGPFTGEISAPMLDGLATYVIIGHSERRALGETDHQIARKLAAAIRNGLTPVLCIGENLIDRQHGLAGKVVTDQLTADLHELTAPDVAKIVIAYEPVWSINHHDGKPVKHALPEDVKSAYTAMRTTLEELYGEEGTSGVRLLYGGSVDPDHCRAYLEMPHVEGLLVGTSSLNYEDFAKIIATAQKLAKP
jgi:triosephosphate isomerase (TIM)